MRIRLSPEIIRNTLIEKLRSRVGDVKAGRLAELFVDADLDGFHTHGLARLPRMLDEIDNGEIKVDAELLQVRALGGWELWDGRAGIGPLHALASTQRVVDLAKMHGVACVALRNTNHWLRPGYYGKQAAGQGCALLCWTNTIPNVVAHGSRTAGLGNNPFTLAIPGPEQPFLLDMALSQFSYGKLAEYMREGKTLPAAGGYDAEGRLTDDAKTIFEDKSAAPIGLWKGSAWLMGLDILAAMLAQGRSTFEIGQTPGEQNVSQVFIAFDLQGFFGGGDYLKRAGELFEQIKQSNPGAHLPGEGAAQRRRQQLQEGIEIDETLWAFVCDKIQ